MFPYSHVSSRMPAISANLCKDWMDMFLPQPFLRYLWRWSAGLAQWCSCVWFGKPTTCIQLNAGWRALKRGCKEFETYNPRCPGQTSSEITGVNAEWQTTWPRNMGSGRLPEAHSRIAWCWPELYQAQVNTDSICFKAPINDTTVEVEIRSENIGENLSNLSKFSNKLANLAQSIAAVRIIRSLVPVSLKMVVNIFKCWECTAGKDAVHAHAGGCEYHYVQNWRRPFSLECVSQTENLSSQKEMVDTRRTGWGRRKQEQGGSALIHERWSL